LDSPCGDFHLSPCLLLCLILSVIHPLPPLYSLLFFFFNDTATTEIYTLSLHDALPIFSTDRSPAPSTWYRWCQRSGGSLPGRLRSEEHTSELQSLTNLVCRLLLEKKKKYVQSTHRGRRCSL